MARISKRAIDGLISRGTPGILRDDDLTGFGARLNANGSVSYFAEYRAGRGRRFPVRRLVLGKQGPLTPDEARRLAKDTLAQVAKGADPAAERTRRKHEQTIAEWLREVLQRHWKAKRRASTASNFEGMIERTLIPQFGTKRLSDLRRAEIRAWHAKQTHRPRQANLDLAILRKALSLAVGDELIKENSAKGITPYPEKTRDRVPTAAELHAVIGALDTAPIRPAAALLFRLLLLTGCRMSEWRTAEWPWVDLKRSVLRLPDAKTGARDVPLSSYAVSLLSAVVRTGKYVVPNDHGNEPLSRSNVRDAGRVCARPPGFVNCEFTTSGAISQRLAPASARARFCCVTRLGIGQSP